MLDPKTVPVLCFQEAALLTPSASWSDQVRPGDLCPVAPSHRAQAPCAHLPRPPCPLVFVWACLCTSNATFRPLLPTPVHLRVCAHVYLWCDPVEGYLLFNLFVEGPPPQQPCSSRPLGVGRGWLWTPGPDPPCVCRGTDLYSG